MVTSKPAIRRPGTYFRVSRELGQERPSDWSECRVRVQSSCFPLYDHNPVTYAANIKVLHQGNAFIIGGLSRVLIDFPVVQCRRIRRKVSSAHVVNEVPEFPPLGVSAVTEPNNVRTS